MCTQMYASERRQSEVVLRPPTADGSKPVVGCTITERTHALVRGFDLLLEHHGASKVTREDLSKQMHSYLDTSNSETVWMKRAKHALTYPLSKYLDNELPPPPDVVFKPTGGLRKWMRARFNAFNRKNTHLWYSWLQIKRAALPVSDDVVDDTYEKHFATLSQEDDGCWDSINSIFSDPTFVAVLEMLRGKVRRAFKKADFLTGRTSSSACFEETRATGGQIARLRKLVRLDGPLSVTEELSSMHWFPRVYGRQTLYNAVLVKRVWSGIDSWSDLGAYALWLDTSAPLKCTIQAVLEPMKVRVISKGNALPYYVARPLQRVLHDTMREMPCFRLIGRPLCPTDLLDLKLKSTVTDQWFSIDYSAATDGLSYRYSGRILRWITADLADWDRELLESVLGPHQLHYPVGGGRVVERGMQRRGQLMGSILSFPILCLANLGVYLDVTREQQSNWTSEERLSHVLVNGDDMVYAAPEDLWSRHVATAKRVGLEMSVGKAYHHRVYANVNSTSLHCDLSKVASTPWQIDYLNTGLFFGQHKVLEKREYGVAEAHLGQSPLSGAAANLNVAIRGSLPGRATSLLRSYLCYHSDVLVDECRTKSGLVRNLFLPETSGGMGCEAPPGWRWKLTAGQRQFASFLLQSQTALKSFSLPLPGYPVEKWEIMLSVPWVKIESVADRPRSKRAFSSVRHVAHLRMSLWSPRLGEYTT